MAQPNLVFINSLVGDADARFMHGIWIATDQGMPFKQGLAFMEQAIGTGARQPMEFAHLIGCQLDAIGNVLFPFWIIGAATGGAVK